MLAKCVKCGWKIYAKILVERVRRVAVDLIEDELVGFRAGRRCVDRIFTLKHIGEKGSSEKCRVYGVYIFGEGVQ